jgi:hypothetical protein
MQKPGAMAGLFAEYAVVGRARLEPARKRSNFFAAVMMGDRNSSSHRDEAFHAVKTHWCIPKEMSLSLDAVIR